MKQGLFTVKENKELSPHTYRMVLDGDTSAVAGPGQFVDIKLPGLFLRRPISVCDCNQEGLTLIYRAVGKGTDELADMEAGRKLDLLTGMGTGYDLSDAGDHPLLIGGGIGCPPLYGLARLLRAMGKEVSVILGFNTASEIFYEDEFRALGCDVTVTTADGSHGMKGFVTNAMREKTDCTYFYSCGPKAMLKAVYDEAETSGISGQFSLEERMGCGFGACMGCTCQTRDGSKRLCKDGPVLRKEEILWES